MPTALPEQYLFSPCEVTTMENDLLLVGGVVDIGEDYVQLGPTREDNLPLLRYNTTVKFAVRSVQAGIMILVGTVYTSTDQVLKLVDVVSLQEFERRSFYRVPIDDLHGKLLPLKEDDHIVAGQGSMPVDVINISLSGILLDIKEDVLSAQIGDRFLMELSLPKGNQLLKIKVCRVQRSSHNSKSYGCEFYDVSQKQADIICGYIFEKEREIIRRKKNQAM